MVYGDIEELIGVQDVTPTLLMTYQSAACVAVSAASTASETETAHLTALETVSPALQFSVTETS
jgi:hypothetical protein